VSGRENGKNSLLAGACNGSTKRESRRGTNKVRPFEKKLYPPGTMRRKRARKGRGGGLIQNKVGEGATYPEGSNRLRDELVRY